MMTTILCACRFGLEGFRIAVARGGECALRVFVAGLSAHRLIKQDERIIVKIVGIFRIARSRENGEQTRRRDICPSRLRFGKSAGQLFFQRDFIGAGVGKLRVEFLSVAKDDRDRAARCAR